MSRYRLFSMNDSGRLYQLSEKGWILQRGVTFPTIASVRHFLYNVSISELPNTVDAYIARVDADGMIEATFSILPMKSEKED